MGTINLAAAKNFLRNNMFDTVDKFARESTKDTGNNYYINSANGLYFTVMEKQDTNNAMILLREAIKQKKNCCRGNETLFTMWQNTLSPRWNTGMKVQYAFKNAPGDENWTTLKHGYITNNNSTGTTRDKTENKVNIRCFYCIERMREYYRTGTGSILTDAQTVWSSVLSMFNDSQGGYVDDQPSYRETYKQALVKMASKFKELKSVGDYQEPTGMWDGTLQDSTTGGIYARYIKSGGVCNNNGQTFENTEATSAMIMAYDNYDHWRNV